MIGAYTPLIAAALSDQVPAVEDLDPVTQLIVDGTLLDCWSWKDHPELHFDKHQTTGFNVQVACTHSGHPAWVSNPHDGRVHETPRLCAAPDCLTCHPPTSQTEPHRPGILATRDISDWE